jgi:hypothetical protein
MIMRRKCKYLLNPIIVLLLFVAGFTEAKAQKPKDLKLNEILVYNNTNCVDNYGIHSAWIEIYNPTNNFVNIGGCYLSDDLNNPTKCWIPNGDRSTIMEPKSYLIFWADGKPERGIFHLNFELKEAKVLALYDDHGGKLLDKVEIAQPQKPDVTYGRTDKAGNGWEFLDKSTPGTCNDFSKNGSPVIQEEKVDNSGSKGIVQTILIVLFTIVFLFIVYKIWVSYFSKKGTSTVLVKEKEQKSGNAISEDKISGEVNAAIAMALYMYQNDLHDYENAVLTMQRVSRTYSPWSSKIYTLRKSPR